MIIYTPQKVATIYRATNKINGKSYIGFDSKWPSRQKDHKSSLQKESSFAFHKALKKYGWDNFSWEVLYQSTDVEHTLSVMESHFIIENDSYNNGYNMTLGGEGTFGLIITEERRLKMSNANVFVERSSAKHDFKYDYSKTTYKNQSTLITIICPDHGEFHQLPKTHLMGYGCQYCSGNKSDSDYFIEKAKKKHNDRFSYENVEYIDSVSQVKNILCYTHGLFKVSSAASHYRSNHGGCPGCVHEHQKNSRLIGTKKFIERAIEKHGEKYDYSKVEYNGATKKIQIGCPVHGIFHQRAQLHIEGPGCPHCSLDSRWERNKL